MATRKGTGIVLDDLIREAIRRVRVLIEEKNPVLPDKETIATQVGIGALVFADLKSKRVKDIDFSWEEALSFEGETGPYLQYTHARLSSILRKYSQPVRRDVKFERLSEPEELQVCRKLWNYPAVVRQAAEAYEPSVLSGYLLDLAASVNSYYHKHKVINEDADLAAARILLVDCARQVMANGLALLGIAAPQEM
jgi:arginyl-tRNA synthetase